MFDKACFTLIVVGFDTQSILKSGVDVLGHFNVGIGILIGGWISQAFLPIRLALIENSFPTLKVIQQLD